jgi:Anti-sigma-K factor rskA/Sigma-70, region 4
VATFDQLSADQRAIIELVLKQGQSYDRLGDMLGMPVARVRELAREALVRLSPVSASAVEDEWRGRLADYLLGQQSGSEENAARRHLRSSEAARGWARSVLDSLEQFYDADNLPTIPKGAPEPAAEPREPEAPAPEAATEPDGPAPEAAAEPKERRPELSPEGQAALQQRRIIAGLVLAAVVVVVASGWALVKLIGGGDGDSEAARNDANAQTRVLGALPLQTVAGARRGRGVAVVAEKGSKRSLIVNATLPRLANRQAYEVWLYNSDKDAKSMGAQVTDQRGGFQGAATLPGDFERYRFIDVSRERIDRNVAHSGRSVLRGRIDQLRPVPQNAQPGAAQP